MWWPAFLLAGPEHRIKHNSNRPSDSSIAHQRQEDPDEGTSLPLARRHTCAPLALINVNHECVLKRMVLQLGGHSLSWSRIAQEGEHQRRCERRSGFAQSLRHQCSPTSTDMVRSTEASYVLQPGSPKPTVPERFVQCRLCLRSAPVCLKPVV